MQRGAAQHTTIMDALPRRHCPQPQQPETQWHATTNVAMGILHDAACRLVRPFCLCCNILAAAALPTLLRFPVVDQSSKALTMASGRNT
jgi:hypothetical protein